MTAVDQLIHARWIIPGNHTRVLENHCLVIQKGLIHDVLPTTKALELYQAKHQEVYESHAIMPGIINAHTHIGMNFFRGLADDLSLMTWLQEHIFPAEKKWLCHAFVKDASLIAMAEMIRSGTTCFNDMFYFLEATAEAAELAGLRAHIGMSVLEFPTPWADSAGEYLKKGLDFYEHYKNHPLITTTLAPHAPYTVSDETFKRVAHIAEQYQLKINLHLHETQDEIQQSLKQFNKRPIQRLHDLGFLSPQVIAIHMANLNNEDFAILEKTKPSIVHCPESNMKLASGICPVTALQKQGLTVALGTDSVASNNDLDMISEMRTASFLSKCSTLNPESLSAPQTLQLATQNGAKALGVDQMQGTLEKNKAADFIAINLDTIETLPIYHPISQIVYSSSRNQITDVWVAGRQLLKNRTLTTLNEEELKEKARYWGQKIKE